MHRGRDAAQAHMLVDGEDRLFIVSKSHGPVANPEMRRAWVSGVRERDLQRILFTGFVTEMKFREFTSGFGEGMEIGRERDARQFLRQIVGEAFPVGGRMQNAVDVIEDRVLGDRVVVVTHAEGAQGRV